MKWIRGAVSSVANAPTYRFLQAGVFVVLGIAFATSFSSGSSGAQILGYQPAFVSSVPLICDIVAALAMVVHGRVRDDPSMRRLAAWFVLVPMLLSWAANALDHLNRKPVSPDWSVWAQRSWITAVVVFAGLAPVAVAGLLHFMARYVEFEKRVAETTLTPGARTQPELSQNSAAEIASEPEFTEPEPRIRVARTVVTETPVLTADEPDPAVEVDAETVQEIDEIEIHRVMRETGSTKCDQALAHLRANPGCSWTKDLQVSKGISRATFYRAKQSLDETAASA